MSAKRKLCEYMAGLDMCDEAPRISRRREDTFVLRVDVEHRSVAPHRSVSCQTDEEKEIKYSENDLNKLIEKMKTELVSKYYQHLKTSNTVDKVLFSQMCEL